MRILILFIFLMIYQNINAQNSCDCYERLLKLSQYYDAIGNHQKAITTIEKALINKEKSLWDVVDYLKLGIIYQNADSLERAMQIIKTAIIKGYPVGELEIIDNLSKLRQSPYWQEIEKELPQLKSKFRNNIDLDYYTALERLLAVDQAIRSYVSVKKGKFQHVDTINYNDFKNLIEEKGFPNQKDHGFDIGYFDLIFLHNTMYSKSLYDEIIDLLFQSQKNCYYKKKDIALMHDRRLVWYDRQAQEFGLWNHWKDKGGYSEMSEIDKVDSRRFEYNLLRLKEHAIKEGRQLPEGYHPIPYPENYFCGYTFTESETE